MRRKLWILMPILIFFIVILLFRFVLLVGFVSSESMEPTLKTGGLFLAFRLFYRIETGDVIVFRHDGELLVKRVAAIGGTLFVLNGKEISVPMGKLIVLGDHAENSFDSRYWNNPFVDEKDVIAKVIGK